MKVLSIFVIYRTCHFNTIVAVYGGCHAGGVRYGSQASVSKPVLPKVKIMTDGKSVDVNSGNSS